jgi:6-phosphogluconolactonase
MRIFTNHEDLAAAAAGAIAEALARPRPKTLIVTGGTSPGAVYDRLSAMDLDWASTTVTLTDDRWVASDSPDSNERLVRDRLLTGRAAGARFLPLKGAEDTPEADALAVEPSLAALPTADAVLLGMGEDGHIASLFPTDPDLAARLDPDGARLCVGVAMAGLAPFIPRITLTVAALLRARLLVLLITGLAKLAIIERVASDPDYAPPVAAILRQTRAPVSVLWAP